jgi:D-amino-acid dehydrogenase
MKSRCIVIGAGIVGVSCAFHLQQKGYQVTLIDAELPGQSCSFGNAACIATSGVVPLSVPGLVRKLPRWLFDPLGPVSIRLRDFPSHIPWFWRFWRLSNWQTLEQLTAAQASLMNTALEDYDAILQATGLSSLKSSSGTIHIYDSEAEYQSDLWHLQKAAAYGFDFHRLSRAELKSMAPCLKLDHGVGVMVPSWHYLKNPARVTAGIAEYCFAQGAEWIQERVNSVQATASGVRLKTGSGRELQADRLVVAAGAWSNQLAAQLDYRVPLIGKRGYHSQVSAPGIQLEYPIMSVSRAFVMTPLEDGLRIAGTAEFASLDAAPDYRRARVLLKQARNYLEGLNTEGATEWMGRRPIMPDSQPVISASPKHANVFYAFGHGHYGITQGPTTGRLVAELAAGAKPSIDLEPFRFDRFKRAGKVVKQ